MKVYVESPCVVSECPRWCAEEWTLYWVDVTDGKYLRHRDGAPATEYESVAPGLGKIGALIVRPNGRLWLFTAGCRVWECAFGGTPRLLYALDGYADRRFNDVYQVGGWFFCGVAQEGGRPGELWRMSMDGRFSCIEPKTAGMPNGMGISPDGTTFYFTVSDERRIYAYDIDIGAGALSGRRVFVDDFAQPGIPDGLCVDPEDGSLYIALWNGSRLEHRSCRGKLLDCCAFPMPKVTSVAVVGERLFVTTGNLDPCPENHYKRTRAGSVFEITKQGKA